MAMPTYLPVETPVVRQEDMEIGWLRLIVQEDGDVCLTVGDGRKMAVGIEFCTVGTGGGRSPRTVKALRELAQAMYLDNLENPLDRGS